MTRVLTPAVVAVLGAIGLTVARHNPDQAPVFVAVAAVLALLAVTFDERGAALGAIGIGAAAAYPTPNGLGPLLVLTGVLLACDLGLVHRRVEQWRYIVDGLVAVPALAGLAGTIASQPSHRGVAIGAAAAAALGVVVWRHRRLVASHQALSPISLVAALGAVVVVLAPDRLHALGDLPPATVEAARSVAAAVAVFVLAVVVDVLWAERQAAR